MSTSKKCWYTISKDSKTEDKAATRKKYSKRKILNLLKRYTIIKNKKNLKNNIDFTNLTKLKLTYSSK